MQSNPLAEALVQAHEARRAQTNFRYPFRVVCIYEDALHSDFPIIREVRDYCAGHNVTYGSRQYSAERYSEDIPVKRLPAFHIYERGYSDTQYFDTQPVYAIQRLIWAYEDVQLAKERARRRRQAQWDALASVFSLERFKSKPALNKDLSLSHDLNSTGGTSCEGRSTPRQTPAHASPPVRGGTGLEED